MGKLTICICEYKGADQLRGNREADQRLCFRYTDSTLLLLLKSEISSFLPASVTVQPDLCRTCSETTLLVLPRDGSYIMNNLHLNAPVWHSVTGTYCACMDSFYYLFFLCVFVCFFCLLLSSLFVILHLHRQLSHFLGAFWKVPVFSQSGCILCTSVGNYVISYDRIGQLRSFWSFKLSK